jgi:hypothetical protein
MIATQKHQDTFIKLLNIEHSAIAQKLKFSLDGENGISYPLLVKSIGMIDELSRTDTPEAKKWVVVACAILWTYKRADWDGLNEFLLIALCRVGFPPSTIMVDQQYNVQSQTYSGVGSLLNQFAITVYQLDHEIVVADKKFLITEFQKRVWNKLSEVKLLGISAPTSAGKSFIILLKSVEIILKSSGNIVYIVPTLSLVAQVSSDFNKQLKNFGINNYRICTTFSAEDKGSNRIYVLTQEKAISAFSQEDMPFQNIKVLIVDEIQNIEKVANEDDQRAKTLYDTLIEFSHSTKPELIILSGPRVEGLKDLGIEIFNEDLSDEERTKDSPVVSFTYAISKKGNDYFFNQYCDALPKPNRIKMTNGDLIVGYGSSQYRDDFIDYLSRFIYNLGIDARNIIFSPTTGQARKTALKLSSLRNQNNQSERVDSLVKYIRDTVHYQYDMCLTIPKGVVYHHGKTPSHIRAIIEYAIREKLIDNVVCTTTLMQGVNLPAQNIIMRNPDLAIRAIKGTKPKLTNYELANLRGRAGRLLKDFIGRTFVLEENAFEVGAEQGSLFPEAEKILQSGYGEKFEQFKSKIENELTDNITPNTGNQEYSFLLTYIRQVILKHGNSSRERLKYVGIDLKEDRIKEIEGALLNEISLPKEICYKNRYWDPIDLDQIYHKQKEFVLPSSINEDDLEKKLEMLLLKFKEEFPRYYSKYFDVSDNLLYSACISAKEWMREKTLKEILGKPYFNDSDKIDSRISLIQKEISYGLPMLLKPIYDMAYPKSMFLRFIEIGAYRPASRKMIELNVPRETAIDLCNRYFNNINDTAQNLEEVILRRLREIKANVNFWTQVQLDQII